MKKHQVGKSHSLMSESKSLNNHRLIKDQRGKTQPYPFPCDKTLQTKHLHVSQNLKPSAIHPFTEEQQFTVKSRRRCCRRRRRRTGRTCRGRRRTPTWSLRCRPSPTLPRISSVERSWRGPSRPCAHCSTPATGARPPAMAASAASPSTRLA